MINRNSQNYNKMNRQEAEEIAGGYTAQCESGARDWGWIDSADSPCRSFLFFHPDYYTGSLVGLSCLGMVDVVNEGDPLESYVNFMINAIERPSEAEATLEGLKESFLMEGSPVSLLKAFSILMEDRYVCHILDDGGEYMRLLLAAALESGDQDVAEMISDRGWEVFCKLESGNWGLDPINKEVEGLMEAGDHAGAEKLYRDALEACEIVLGSEGVSTLDCAKNLGDLLIDMGSMDGAEEVFRKELAGRESSQGPDHEDTLSCLTNLSYVMGSKGDMTAAEELCRRALAGYEKSLGPEHSDTLVNVGSLAVIMSSKGDHEAAGDLLRRALTGFGNALGRDAPHTLQCVSSLGANMNQRGDREGAISLLKEYSEHSDAARDALAYNLACYECLDGNHDEAKALIADHIKKHPDNKQQALSDKDLESIHDHIRGL